MHFLTLMGFIVTIFVPQSCFAFQVSTLYKVINQDDHNYITLTGDNPYREYIYTTLSRVTVTKNGELSEEALKPEEVAQWPVIVEPGEIVLDTGEDVRVNITKNMKTPAEDSVLGVAFIPEPAQAHSDKKNTGLHMAIGYKTWLFIPGTAPLVGNISATRKGEQVLIQNQTNKILRVTIDNCTKVNTVPCHGFVFSLPNTTKSIAVKENKATLSMYTITTTPEKLKEVIL